jgi:hypothetical protein
LPLFRRPDRRRLVTDRRPYPSGRPRPSFYLAASWQPNSTSPKGAQARGRRLKIRSSTLGHCSTRMRLVWPAPESDHLESRRPSDLAEMAQHKLCPPLVILLL